MARPDDRKYSREHEWVLVEDGVGTVGITDFAQEELGDIVYLDLPPAGTQVKQYEKMGEIESVKSVSDLYSPVSGEVVEVNQAVVESPELVNQDAFGRGWMVRVRLSDPAELDGLLSAQEYDELVSQGEPGAPR
ncbi:MAG TPA: glycine cleavage system protein GcvH [Dehalococcoidia bacterium]